jgi:hypothetical protein
METRRESMCEEPVEERGKREPLTKKITEDKSKEQQQQRGL